MSKNKRLVPNIVRGGTAIPINKNTFLLRGRKHEQGGIDIGKDLEAEDGELIQLNKNNLKILSNAPIMKGDTPAKYALRGLADNTFKDRFNKGFLYQEKYKDRNHLNDDGTKKKGYTNKAKDGKLRKFFQDAAYKIITQDSVHDDAKANIKDIVTGLATKNPPMDDNKYLFVYGNGEIGLLPADTTKGKNFDKYIKENYPNKKINQYEGTINPYNEYVFDESDKTLIEELAKKKKHFYSNADKEYLDYITQPNADAWGERPEGVYMNTPYREDIGHYPLQFDKDKNGNLVAHAADLYDFNAKEYLKKGALIRAAEAAALTSVGNPYILRQNNIPIRFINLGDKIRKNSSSYLSSTKSGELNDKEKRALNMHAILNDISDEKLSNILGTGHIEPAKVIVKKK